MTAAAILCGMLAGLGCFLVLSGVLPAHPKLSDAFDHLGRRQPLESTAPAPGVEGWGSRLRLPLTTQQQQLLHQQGRSTSDFFLEKMLWLITGAILPLLWAATMAALGSGLSPIPLLVSALGAIGGYFLADLRLKSAAKQLRRQTAYSIHTFFDLVVLERLANASAAQATANAAAMSDTPLFRRISLGLERARLEQTPPWAELHRIAREWDCPELGDFADVMVLEEQGTGLADVLRARVKELREEYLAKQSELAQEASEAMTIWMTIPAMLLGIALLVPAVLGLLQQ